MLTKFRIQAPYTSIYRVGITIGTQPECRYTTIQSAINAAVADGHTSNDNPAYIEIYSGIYTESLTLSPGIHLIGKGTRTAAQDFNGGNNVIIQGQLTYAPVNANTYYQNRVVIQDLKIEALGQALTYSGTASSHLILDNCTVAKASGGAAGAIVESSPSGAVNLFDLYDTVITSQTANDIGMEAASGFIFFWGSYCGVQNDFVAANTIDTAIQITGTPYIQVSSQDGFNANFNKVFDFQAAGIVFIDGATIFNYLSGGAMAEFGAAGIFSISNSLLYLVDNTSSLAIGAVAGTIFDRGGNAFNTDTAGFNYNNVAAAITVYSPILNGSLARDAGSNTIFVKGGRGYETIQEALTYAQTAGGSHNLLISPGFYTEDLTIAANQIKMMPMVPADGYDVAPEVVVTGNHVLSANQAYIQGIYFDQADETVAFLDITGNAALFRDCSFIGVAAALTTHAIEVNNADFAVFDRCKFRHDFLAGGFGFFNLTGSTLEIKNASGSQLNDLFVSGLDDATAVFYLDATSTLQLDKIKVVVGGTDAVLVEIVAGSTVAMDFCDVQVSGSNTVIMINYTTGGTAEIQNCNLAVGGGAAAPRLGEDGGGGGVFRYGSLSINGSQDIDATLTISAFPAVVNPI